MPHLTIATLSHKIQRQRSIYKTKLLIAISGTFCNISHCLIIYFQTFLTIFQCLAPVLQCFVPVLLNFASILPSILWFFTPFLDGFAAFCPCFAAWFNPFLLFCSCIPCFPTLPCHLLIFQDHLINILTVSTLFKHPKILTNWPQKEIPTAKNLHQKLTRICESS